jgi:antitoxin MazE
MKTKIIQIGNSQGIRIPKPFLEQTGLGEEVELEVRADELVIRSAKRMRAGWDTSFAKMAESGDDVLLDSGVAPNHWDEEEWTW